MYSIPRQCYFTCIICSLYAEFSLVVCYILLQYGKFGKLNKPIQFPEILNLAPFMSGTSDKSPIYRLYGVVVHLDTMNAAFSGHYVCYVKNIKNRWFKVDDSVVSPLLFAFAPNYKSYSLLVPKCIFLRMVFLISSPWSFLFHKLNI